MYASARHHRGFTLVEIFIVVAIMGILAGLLIPSFEPNVPQRLQATADVIVADLALVRSLAVGNSSTYKITFDPTENEFYFEHTGSVGALDDLPSLPFADYGDSSDRRTTRLNDIPTLGTPAQLVNVYKTFSSGSPQVVSTLEFGSLGQTTRSEPTVIWLSSGQSRSRRYQSITVDPVTGLASVDHVVSVLPTGVTAP